MPIVEPFAMKRIEEYSGGNPLYLEELCHAINDSRFDFDTKKAGSWLNSLIYTRFDQLPETLANFVKVSAIIGQVIPTWLIDDITGTTLGSKQLQDLRETDFLYPADKNNYLRFKHGITRDVIYDMIHLKERQKLHSEIIEKLKSRARQYDETDPHEELAYHSRQAGLNAASLYHSRIARGVRFKGFFAR